MLRRRRVVARRLIPVLALVIGGCVADIALRDDPWTRYPPPPEYRVWYDEMLACSGVQEPHTRFQSISFVYVDRPYVRPIDSTRVNLAETEMNAVFRDWAIIVVPKTRVMDEKVLRHELLHAILGPVGHPFIPGTFPCGIWTAEGYTL